MRCKTCNYRLWQLTARQCPECGSPFKPSDFEFVPNSVRFCCPHCNQAYYGNGPRGHLVPPHFNCITCGREVDMDEMVVLPAEGVPDEQTDAIDVPWLERDRYGVVKAWWKTVGRALTRPGDLARAVPPESSGWTALWFALATQGAISSVALIPMLVLFVIAGASASRPGGGVGLHTVGIVLGFIIAVFGGILLALGVSTLVTHTTLRVTGGCAWGMKRTWQAMCYSSGANVLTAIPCFGGYFGWIWWVVSAILMLKSAQKVHGGRATLAVLITPALIILVFIGGYAGLIYFAIQSGAVRTQTFTAGPGLGTSSVSGALAASAQRGAAAPRHLAELLASGKISEHDLIDNTYQWEGMGEFPKRASAMHIGSIPITAWSTTAAEDRQAAAQLEASKSPENAVAYRLLDLVATDGGVKSLRTNPFDGSDQVWLVVRWPDGLSKEETQGVFVEVGLAGGGFSRIDAASFDVDLAAQNRLRAKLGLPLIPHPADVKSDKPVVRDDAKYAPPPERP